MPKNVTRVEILGAINYFLIFNFKWRREKKTEIWKFFEYVIMEVNWLVKIS